MEDYKVAYELLDAGYQVTEWMDKKSALKEFEKLKASGKCIWAELLEDSLDEEESFYGARVVKQFTNKVLEILGVKVLVPVS